VTFALTDGELQSWPRWMRECLTLGDYRVGVLSGVWWFS
jgi:hypothetical protein